MELQTFYLLLLNAANRNQPSSAFSEIFSDYHSNENAQLPTRLPFYKIHSDSEYEIHYSGNPRELDSDGNITDQNLAIWGMMMNTMENCISIPLPNPYSLHDPVSIFGIGYMDAVRDICFALESGRQTVSRRKKHFFGEIGFDIPEQSRKTDNMNDISSDLKTAYSQGYVTALAVTRGTVVEAEFSTLHSARRSRAELEAL